MPSIFQRIKIQISLNSHTRKHVKQFADLPNSEFIDQCYKSLLKRSPDPEGKNHYLRWLSNGKSRESIYLAIASSKERKLISEFVDEFQSTVNELPRNQNLEKLKNGGEDVNIFSKSTFNTSGKEMLSRETILNRQKTSTILFLSHDASLTGAPSVLLEIGNWFQTNTRFQAKFVVAGRYITRIKEFEAIGPTLYLKDLDKDHTEIIFDFLCPLPEFIYANSIASGDLLQVIKSVLPNADIPTIGHIHELSGVMKHFLPQGKYFADSCDSFVAVSNESAKDFSNFCLRRKSTIEIVPPFISPWRGTKNNFLPGKTKIIGCGTIEHRKGFDLFCETLKKLSQTTEDFIGVWIGPSHSDTEPNSTINKYNVETFVLAVGPMPDPRAFYEEGDIFFLSSREDPFPLVAIEAAEQGLPILCFDGGSKPICELVKIGQAGLICRHSDTSDAAHCLTLLLSNKTMRLTMGKNAQTFSHQNFYSTSLLPKIYDHLLRVKRDLGKRRKPDVQKVLVVSLGPPPIPGFDIVEGGGLRTWGLCKIFKLAGFHEITIAFPSWYVNKAKETRNQYEGITIRQWSSSDELSTIAKSGYDVLVISYCAGPYTSIICDAKTNDQTLILDCYVPIHVEVSARRSKNLIGEEAAFHHDSNSWNSSFRYANLLLCANENQRHYYYGLLAGIGELSPISYKSFEKILLVPFGFSIHESNSLHRKSNVISADVCGDRLPLESMASQSGKVSLLWFGGVYPWFDIKSLFGALNNIRDKVPLKFDVVGLKNPFNNHPDFVSASSEAISVCSREPYNEFITVHDWVPFQDRLNWYESADLLVSLNQPGIENIFAWRTRVVDYLSAGVRFATNGGDPLSESLIAFGYAFRLDISSQIALEQSLLMAIKYKCSEFNLEKVQSLIREISWEESAVNLSSAMSKL